MVKYRFWLFTSKLLALLGSNAIQHVLADFDASANSNLAMYWGQNSYGEVGSQDDLSSYCEDSTNDILLLSFVTVFFGTGGLPEINFAGSCEGSYFDDSELLDCPTMASDIVTCQDNGKKIFLSLGGSSGSYGFDNDTEAEEFATTIWDIFGGGSSDTRPFGTAVVDGFDLDIEGGSSTGYSAFVTKMRNYYDEYVAAGGKQMYISGAPQCPIPDSFLNDAMETSYFDFYFVQFYNNYCGINFWEEGTSNTFNFDAWDTFAQSSGYNPDAKVYLGVPASSDAAGTGYVDIDTLTTIISELASTYTSFGGVMMWDASQAYNNIPDSSSSLNYAQLAKQALADISSANASSTSAAVSASATSTTASSTIEVASTSTEYVASETTSSTYDNGYWTPSTSTATSTAWSSTESETDTETYWDAASSTTSSESTSTTDDSGFWSGDAESSATSSTEYIWAPSSTSEVSVPSSSFTENYWVSPESSSTEEYYVASSTSTWEGDEATSTIADWEPSTTDYASTSTYDDGMWNPEGTTSSTSSATLITVSSIDNIGQTWYMTSTVTESSTTEPTSTSTTGYPVVGVSRTVVSSSTSTSSTSELSTDIPAVTSSSSSTTVATPVGMNVTFTTATPSASVVSTLSSTTSAAAVTPAISSSSTTSEAAVTPAISSSSSSTSTFPTAGVSTTTMVGGDGFTTTAIISVATMTSVETPSTVYESSTSETDTEAASSATTSVASFNSDPITVTEEETVTAPAVTTTLTESTTTTSETTSKATTTVATTETKLTFVPRAPFTATVSILDETSTASATESATSSASSSGTPVSCPVEGAACAVHGELACNGYSYGQCVWGTWVVRQCYTGLACMDDGDEIACDYPGPSGVQACSESGISTDSAKLMKRGVWDEDLEYNHEMAESNDIWQHMHRKAKRSITHDHVLRKPVARRDESPFYDAELGKKHHPHVPMRKLHAHEDKPAPAARPRPRHLQHMKAAIMKREEAVTAAATVTGMAAMPTMLQQVEFCPDGTSRTYIAGSATTTATASASATASALSSELEDLTLDSSDNNTYLLRVVTQQVNSTTFVGTLYAAPLTNSPIGQDWKFSFTSDDTITSVSRGELVAGDDGSYTINSISTQEGKRYMAIKVTFWGTYNTDS